jgi:hypothetical protein
MGRSFDRHCEHGEAIESPWIAAPLSAARDDVFSWFRVIPMKILHLCDSLLKRGEPELPRNLN